mmetsp:Transcript_115679/g.247229  ORF Transcript_115679/g.247229 Transcript_115679/m.247229 type:complete len:939 (+) Transcript_115679:158-2974(+)
MFQRLAGLSEVLEVKEDKSEADQSAHILAVPVKKKIRRFDVGRLLYGRRRKTEAECPARRSCLCCAPPPYAVVPVPQMSPSRLHSAPAPRTSSSDCSLASLPPTSAGSQPSKMSWSKLQAKLVTEYELCSGGLKPPTSAPPLGRLGSASSSARQIGSRGGRRPVAEGTVRRFLQSHGETPRIALPGELQDQLADASSSEPPAMDELPPVHRRSSVLVQARPSLSGLDEDLAGEQGQEIADGVTSTMGARMKRRRSSKWMQQLPLGQLQAPDLDQQNPNQQPRKSSTFSTFGGMLQLPGLLEVPKGGRGSPTTGDIKVKPPDASGEHMLCGAAGQTCPSPSQKKPLAQRLRRLERKRQKEQEHAKRLRLFNSLPQEDTTAMQMLFEQFDKDSSGFLEHMEAVACLRELGLRGTNTLEKREINRICKEATKPPKLQQGGPGPTKEEEAGTSKRVVEMDDDSIAIDLLTFALTVVPQVRIRLGELQSDELLRQFYYFDKDGSGKLPIDMCMELIRRMGIDRRLMWREFEERGNSAIGFEEFKKIVIKGREQEERTVREHERHIKETSQVSDHVFDEFRQDIITLYDMFQRYDADGSGELNYMEIMMAVKEFGLEARNSLERQVMHDLLGGNGHADDILEKEYDFEEFLAFVTRVRKHKQSSMRAIQMERFQKYDRDNSGTLAGAEISNLLCDVGCVPRTRKEQEEIALIIHLVDSDGNGFIDFQEFQVLRERIDEHLKSMRYDEEVEYALCNGFTESQLRELRWAFDSLDEDGSGKLGKSEVANALSIMGKQVPIDAFETAFYSLDVDGNGELDFLEFLDFLRLMRDGEGIFAEDSQKLATQAKFLETRLLRRGLEYFRLSKVYINSQTREELIDLVCDFFKINPNDDIYEKLKVRNVSELLEAAKEYDTAAVRKESKAKARKLQMSPKKGAEEQQGQQGL